MEYFYFAAIIFLASFLQGITGFGFAILAAPLCLLFFDQTTVVVVLAVLSILLNLLMIKRIRKAPDPTLTYHLLRAGLLGVPVGVMLLLMIDTASLKLLTIILALLFLLLNLWPQVKIAQNRFLTVNIGFLTGVFQAGIGLSGPPIALLLNLYGLDKTVVRKTLATVFFAISALSLPLFLFSGVITAQVLWLSFVAMPVLWWGGWLGDVVAGKIKQAQFKLLSVLVVIAAVSYTFVLQYLRS